MDSSLAYTFIGMCLLARTNLLLNLVENLEDNLMPGQNIKIFTRRHQRVNNATKKGALSI